MEKTNKIEKININCATKIEQLEQLYDLVCKFKDKYSQYKRMAPIEEKVFNTLYELCDKEELDIVDTKKKNKMVNNNSQKAKLEELKELYDDNIIREEEYLESRKKILEN